MVHALNLATRNSARSMLEKKVKCNVASLVDESWSWNILSFRPLRLERIGKKFASVFCD